MPPLKCRGVKYLSTKSLTTSLYLFASSGSSCGVCAAYSESFGGASAFFAVDSQLQRMIVRQRVKTQVFKTQNFSDEIGYPVNLFKNEQQKQIQVYRFLIFARNLISIFAVWRQKQVIQKRKLAFYY